MISEYSRWFWDWISATQTVCPHADKLTQMLQVSNSWTTTETWKLPAPMPPDSANSYANVSLTTLFTFYPERDINFCLEFHHKSSKSCWDISLKTTNLNSTVVIKEKRATTNAEIIQPVSAGRHDHPHSQTLALECTEIQPPHCLVSPCIKIGWVSTLWGVYNL